ncbi:SLCO4A [Mytilus edulis]|uniref:SLCO4A n=1 Tax=Mytilus edulis TaxID=6550 RepID=A0A8S3VC60_MYTED|nr:SLCO4A [Mytilus edulis]
MKAKPTVPTIIRTIHQQMGTLIPMLKIQNQNLILTEMKKKAPLDFYKSDEKKPFQDLTGSDLKPDINNEWEEQNLRYGWFNYKPRWAQVFNSIRWFVFWTCVFSLVQGFIVNGVINAVISTLEKRYELPSSKSGLIASSNDFFAFFLVLAISYYGGKRNKPKLIGIGILTLGIGSIVFSLPQFLAGEYNFGSTDLNQFENVCRNTTESCEGSQEKKSHLQKYLYVFMLGNALHGAGSTPMFTLGTTFIDENTKAEMTSLYLGMYGLCKKKIFNIGRYTAFKNPIGHARSSK